MSFSRGLNYLLAQGRIYLSLGWRYTAGKRKYLPKVANCLTIIAAVGMVGAVLLKDLGPFKNIGLLKTRSTQVSQQMP